MLECVKNTVNIYVFDRFRFFNFFMNFEFPGLDFSCFLGVFWALFLGVVINRRLRCS